MLTMINTIITSESPEPRYQFEFTVNSCSIIFPIRLTLPPPSMLDITNVVSAGIKTMVTPLAIPGILSGKITLLNT